MREDTRTICAACGVAFAPEGESICERCYGELMSGGPSWDEGGQIERPVASENPVPVWW